MGSGTSHGVPMIGCRCPVCTSSDPHDKRTRPSIFVRMGEERIIVDTAPELRLQCVDNGIDRIDAVLFTHHHADHISGLDDVRRFNWIMARPVRCYGTERTLAGVRQMFRYVFEPAPDSPHSRPDLELHEIDERPLTIGDQTIIPIPLMHGPMPVLGFRFGGFAYCTDCNYIPEMSLALMKDLDVLVLEAVRRKPHPAHFNLEQAVAVARCIGAKQTYFTHIAHQLGHEQTNRELPPGMALAYDGLRIRVQ
jgi:phosphoribosyl 1,2-cyclic phosphate phosphodiesterase